MTVVAGYAPDARDRAVLDLAGMLARSAGEDVVLCAVVPAPWLPSPARVDAEYRAYLDAAASSALEHAGQRLPPDVGSSAVVHRARSVPAGLLEVAEQHDGQVVVVGSGHGALGSVTGRLLHGAHVPVALAPHGFRADPDGRVERLTLGFGGPDDALVAVVGEWAERVGATVRFASFVVRPAPPYTAGVGREADEAMVREWIRDIEAEARAALDRVGVAREVVCAVGRGETWAAALDDVEWRDGDVLVVGSSPTGPAARVFLGSRAAKIVRHSPVPTVVVPRSD